MQKKIILLSLAAALFVNACAGLKSKTKYEILDHKGAALEDSSIPKWLSAYLEGGELQIERMAEHSGYYCFVGTEEGPNKQMVTRWAQTVSGPALIATQVSIRLEQMTSGDVGADNSSFQQSLKQVSTTAITATFSGARKVNDWWVWRRAYDPKNHKQVISEDYSAYVLYIIEKKQLDKQVAAELQNTIDNRKNMSADERKIYTDLIQKIMSRGLGV
ncbi:MAG: hypothetical protein Pg6A_02370 [Termitinemataceae bacterium]|nr:MAG: hypothetical protein Pg6A_02370 [Termitinemataceae bacterium]